MIIGLLVAVPFLMALAFGVIMIDLARLAEYDGRHRAAEGPRWTFPRWWVRLTRAIRRKMSR